VLEAATVQVGTCRSGVVTFSTIQPAVNASPAGASHQVSAESNQEDRGDAARCVSSARQPARLPLGHDCRVNYGLPEIPTGSQAYQFFSAVFASLDVSVALAADHLDPEWTRVPRVVPHSSLV
jgi:hypothetical protein